MPVMLPPRAGLSMSQAVAQAYSHNPADDPIILTLEILHPDFRDDNNQFTSARVANDWTSFTATLEDDAPVNAGDTVEFVGVPFRYSKPDQSDNGAPSAVQIEFDDVSRQLTKYLDQVVESMTPIRIIERIYLASDPSGPHELPVMIMDLINVKVQIGSSSIVSGQAVFGDLTNRKFPSRTYTRERYPALGQ